MYQFSDSDTTDSDDGIRFKTATTRHKHKEGGHSKDNRRRRRSRSRSRSRNRHRSKSRSPKRHHNSHKKPKRSHRRSRSKSYDRNSKTTRSKSNDCSTSRSTDLGRRRSRSKSTERSKTMKKSPEDDNKQVDFKIQQRNSVENNGKDVSGPVLPQKMPDILDNRERHSCCTVLSSNLRKSKAKKQNTIKIDNVEIIDISNENSEEEIIEAIVHKDLVDKDSISGLLPALGDQTLCDSALPPTSNENLSGPVVAPRKQESTFYDSSKVEEPVLEPPQIEIELPGSTSSPETEHAVCGPALPPHLLQKKPFEQAQEDVKQEITVGPFIPEHLRKQLAEQAHNITSALLESKDTEMDQDCYGPLPADFEPRSQAHIALEERALQMKLDQLTPQSTEAGREEWMLELPTVHSTNLGLGPRQFRAKAGPDFSDRSSWTDTPNSKKTKSTEKAIDVKKEAELHELKKRDDEQEAMVKKSKKKNKRDKSLLEQHQEKINAKNNADKEEGKAIRKPFNRDTDLKVNQFDDAQKKSIMKKAQLLDDRFSQGQAKFL